MSSQSGKDHQVAPGVVTGPSTSLYGVQPTRPEGSREPGVADSLNQSEAVAQPKQLIFITVTDRPESAKATYSHVVRTQAMRSFLRAKREESTFSPKKTETASSRAAPVTAKSSQTKFKLSTWSRKSPKNNNPSSAPDESDNTSYTINSFALNPEGNWISFSFKDPALLHATLGVVALHRDLLIHREPSADSLTHKGQAIHAINSRLLSGQPPSDENLAVVAVLIKLETLHGTSDASKPHMKGLMEMLRIRGGVNNLMHNQVLLRVLTWIDLLYATMWGSKPCIAPNQLHPGPLAVILEDIAIKYLPIAQYKEGPSMFSLNEHINFDVWETLQQISAAKAKASELSLEERKTISHVIYLVNHRLLMDLAKCNSCEASSLYKAFSVAAILYLHLIIREIPRMARIHLPLTERLRLFVKCAFTTQVIEGQVLGFVVWMIFLGAAASPPGESSDYFINLLALILETLGIQDKDQLRNQLRELAWFDDISDRYLTIVWAEMTATS
ncbi:hypothetical protein VE01_07982 [Pseudogymnoascus verrucosus]|uniref:Uncharacterized protein n=1 Tax=Pseudogymnoascus verrucosus TaxID=342668 RepID=A0A1B8GFN9_9PEZI|nr:uncharacterized protein VE01_07982 [Pseudogymnoascus verrucosus]OBT94644.1 hypothetical protein VE01_07982 [Pseudogymnoascus verrucosus]